MFTLTLDTPVPASAAMTPDLLTRLRGPLASMDIVDLKFASYVSHSTAAIEGAPNIIPQPSHDRSEEDYY